jgi:ABC-2 type transport system permease protein
VALIVTVGANIVLAGLLGLAGIVTGLPATGSFMAGLAVGAIGVVFAGVAAVTVQLSRPRAEPAASPPPSSRSPSWSAASNMLGTVDASGAVVSAWPVWLSPVGTGQQMRLFGATSGGPLCLFAVAFVGRCEHARNPARRRQRHPRRSTRTR